MKLKIFLVFVSMTYSYMSYSQSLLSSTISIRVKNQALHEVLTIISNESNVNFSYNSKTINRDSLISLNAINRPLSEVLRMIFNASYEFKESGNYIIIRKKPIGTSTIVSKQATNNDYYVIEGDIVDDETGEKIADASIYEKQHLLSTMTDERGHFLLKLKSKYPAAYISVSKVNYKDTSFQMQSKLNHMVSIALTRKESEPYFTENKSPKYFTEPLEEDVVNQDVNIVEKKWIGRVLLSSKQQIQSLNLKRFYTTKAYQISVWPGVGTHGKLNAQVNNQTSINLIGGYSGGVDAFEIGLLFNIVKRNVQIVQVAGLFNVVGGNVHGVEIASLFNQVEGNVDGVQVAGLANIVKKEMKGIQISTLYNQAKSIKGLQIGLINKTDTQEGTSIGLINISKNSKGKKRVGFVIRFPRNQKIDA